MTRSRRHNNQERNDGLRARFIAGGRRGGLARDTWSISRRADGAARDFLATRSVALDGNDLDTGRLHDCTSECRVSGIGSAPVPHHEASGLRSDASDPSKPSAVWAATSSARTLTSTTPDTRRQAELALQVSRKAAALQRASHGLPTAAVGSSQAPPAAVDNPAPRTLERLSAINTGPCTRGPPNHAACFTWKLAHAIPRR